MKINSFAGLLAVRRRSHVGRSAAALLLALLATAANARQSEQSVSGFLSGDKIAFNLDGNVAMSGLNARSAGGLLSSVGYAGSIDGLAADMRESDYGDPPFCCSRIPFVGGATPIVLEPSSNVMAALVCVALLGIRRDVF